MTTSSVMSLSLRIRVEPQLADSTGDDLFLFRYHGNAKGVVDDSLLHRVHRVEVWEKSNW